MATETTDMQMRRKELRWQIIGNVLLAGVIGGLITVVLGYLDLEHKRKELALTTGDLEFKLVGDPIQKIIRDPCGKDGSDGAMYLEEILRVGIVKTDNEGKYEELSRRLRGRCSPIATLPGVCQEIKSIRELGWRSGNKTTFCKDKQYAGVWNAPNTSYDSGGFCYKGNDAACRAEIEKK